MTSKFGETSVLALFLSMIALPVAAAQAPQQTCFSTDTATSGDRRIEDCTALIDAGRLPPGSLAIALQNRATALLDKGERDRAIQDYDRAIALNPRYANAFNGRGVAYEAKGDNERALQDYSEAIRIDPMNANALNGRCWLRAAVGELQTALADCNESLKVRPNNSNALDSRAFVYLRLSRWDDALADAEAALKANPKNAWALFERGIAKRRKGDTATGDTDISASRNLDRTAEMEFASFGLRP